ncbi:MAG TPA: 4-hydroxythreonine-4-phosphate dehydrogenase PdxA [Alphaproteobacteria bacterium]|nr:4-hydroxythreonine-4-phosphate dehydrogenase PdxA [Alphaproteobacteria bacterium]
MAHSRVQPPLAVTMGEPAGIGGELTLIAWGIRMKHGVPVFFAIDDPERLERLSYALGWSIPVRTIDQPEEAPAVWHEALPVLPIALPAPEVVGKPDPANGEAVLESVRKAVSLALDGRASAIVTNPIQKSALYAAGFRHPGHTEYLAELAGAEAAPVMMLACPDLRVVPVTVHLPLREVADRLTTADIVRCATITAEALRRDFALSPPRLSVAGFNPHAGEGGALGREEIEVIVPAIEELKRRGLAVDGPFPADTLFHDRAREQYDAAICMYHDQALIPLKTIDFDGGVNITLGLPFVRTSPDHGTALSIAGKGIANPESFIEALSMAERLSAQRARHAAAANTNDLA